MAVTYYVALPFIRTDDGEHRTGRLASWSAKAKPPRLVAGRKGMSRDPANAGGVAFKRAGDPNVGEFFRRGSTEESSAMSQKI